MGAGRAAAAPAAPAAPSVAPGAEEDTAAESEAARNDLREHVVLLLLDNIPRSAKSGEGGLPMLGAKEEEEVEGGRGAVSRDTGDGQRQRKRRRRESRRKDKDCTQLFDVLCALVERSIKLARAVDQDRAGGGSSGGATAAAAAVAEAAATGPKHGRLDVDGLAANVVERLLEHPCTERRGAREADKDTLLVSEKKKSGEESGEVTRALDLLFLSSRQCEKGQTSSTDGTIGGS